jgi:hypothetical protein
MSTRDKIAAGVFANKEPYPHLRNPDRDALLKAYRQAEGRANEEFRASLEEEHGVADHPKRNVLWSIAWDRGH